MQQKSTIMIICYLNYNLRHLPNNLIVKYSSVQQVMIGGFAELHQHGGAGLREHNTALDTQNT